MKTLLFVRKLAVERLAGLGAGCRSSCRHRFAALRLNSESNSRRSAAVIVMTRSSIDSIKAARARSTPVHPCTASRRTRGPRPRSTPSGARRRARAPSAGRHSARTAALRAPARHGPLHVDEDDDAVRASLAGVSVGGSEPALILRSRRHRSQRREENEKGKRRARRPERQWLAIGRSRSLLGIWLLSLDSNQEPSG